MVRLHGTIPAMKNLVSVLVSNTLENAKIFQSDNVVIWPIALDEDSSLFNEYCSPWVMRCFVVHDPDAGVVFSTTQEMTIDQLKAQTGAWY